jgi:hypothetical protein
MITSCCNPQLVNIRRVIPNSPIATGFDETKHWSTPPIEVSAGTTLCVEMSLGFPPGKDWFFGSHTGWFCSDFVHLLHPNRRTTLRAPYVNPEQLVREIPWIAGEHSGDAHPFNWLSPYWDFLGCANGGEFSAGFVTNIIKTQFAPPESNPAVPRNRVVGAHNWGGHWVASFHADELIRGYFAGTEYLMTYPLRLFFELGPCGDSFADQQMHFHSRVNTEPFSPFAWWNGIRRPDLDAKIERRSSLLVHIYTLANP